jgi:hypothetical protein
MDEFFNWLTKWNDFLWRKHDPKQSISMDEIYFDGWKTHLLNELCPNAIMNCPTRGNLPNGWMKQSNETHFKMK